jgi:hypothetical protein
VARAPGFAPASQALRGGARNQTVTLRLKPAPEDAAPERVLAGRGVEASGVSVPEAVVTLGAGRGRGRGGGALLPVPVRTDAQGRFRFEAVPAQVGWAQAWAGELLSDRVAVEPGDAEVVLTVRLADLEGRHAALVVKRDQSWFVFVERSLSSEDREYVIGMARQRAECGIADFLPLLQYSRARMTRSAVSSA